MQPASSPIRIAIRIVPYLKSLFLRRHDMSIQSRPEGSLLVDNLTEAMRRQCELPAEAHSPYEIALEMDTAEALQSAYRHAADHLIACTLCRTGAPKEIANELC